MLTDTQLRGLLQLPPRPYSENILYDGTRYYDLSHFEPLAILGVIGTNGSNTAYAFTQGTDVSLNNGTVDFNGGLKPVLGSTFNVEYQYSPLGLAAASTSVFLANTVVPQQLGSAFAAIVGTNSPAGTPYADLRTFGQMMFAAAYACRSISTSGTETSVKYRRGGLLMDESMKPKNWSDLADTWEAKYQTYINMIRLSGQPSGLQRITANAYNLVFPPVGTYGDPGCIEMQSAYAAAYGDWL